MSNGIGRRDRVIGNLTLTLLALSLGLFYGWVKLTPHPADMPLTLFGLFNVSLSKVLTALGVVGGWLSLAAIFSVKNLPAFLRKPWNPLAAIDNAELRRLIASPGTLVLAVIVTLATGDIVLRNGVIALHSNYEVLLLTPSGSPARLLTPDGKVTSRSTLLPVGETLYLSDLAPWNVGVVLIRDGDDLLTLEALCVSRMWLRSTIESCPLEVPTHAPPLRWPRQIRPQGLIPRGGFEVEISGNLRGYGREIGVFYEGMGDDGNRRSYPPFYLGPGDPAEGPPSSGAAWADKLLLVMHEKRTTLRDWGRKPWMKDPDGQRVLMQLPGYALQIFFHDSVIKAPGLDEPLASREVYQIRVSATPQPASAAEGVDH